MSCGSHKPGCREQLLIHLSIPPQTGAICLDVLGKVWPGLMTKAGSVFFHDTMLEDDFDDFVERC
jgi:hypothetical protein